MVGNSLCSNFPWWRGWDNAVAVTREKGFYNHCPNAVIKVGPIYFFLGS